jgi:hypothetical protein
MLTKCYFGGNTMAIKTSTFGAITLSGKAAKAFRQQFLSEDFKPNPKAQKAFENGQKSLKEMQEKGYAIIRPAK